ncbi:hypothetical protein CERZMDRAFT_99892 [Cercospora zeae-maydis SCOH1-5]|uniref:Alpha/beta hydrolase fold-3 domain-containing protein n=1 Tax=Cercospora zeae-maydis SCOH1-5 TaxID=717836 RepID=A0A6A6F8W7_9PEZI|nr:hypothetical protein CERZMDRAFT_99892 [Cercospora zeae-maydis SCOH1-5]
MPSAESDAMRRIYQRTNSFLDERSIDPEWYRVVMEEMSTVSAEPTDVTYEEVQCPGSGSGPAIWCKPVHASSTRVILYLHGGAFLAGSPSSHRKTVGHLAKRTGTLALLIHYRRTPEHQFPAQIEDAVAAYRWLVEDRGFSRRNVAIAGDSAGGNMTIAAALSLRQQGIDMPAALAAFSPWTDMSLSGESYKRNAGKDAAVQPEAMPGAVNMYLGKASLGDALVDLIHTDLSGLPPMYLTSGTAELLEDDATMLAANARAAKIDVQMELAEDMQHDWIFMAGNAPEADDTLEQAARFLRHFMGI